MVPRGKELLLGAVRDPQFGPMVMIGFGGIYVEVLNDTAARLAPVTAAEALAMLDELRMAPVLHGVRGEPAVDLVALAETISRFASLAVDLPDLVEVELNPLLVSPEGQWPWMRGQLSANRREAEGCARPRAPSAHISRP
jgi:acetyltransferase